jgi:hypothetical protein
MLLSVRMVNPDQRSGTELLAMCRIRRRLTGTIRSGSPPTRGSHDGSVSVSLLREPPAPLGLGHAALGELGPQGMPQRERADVHGQPGPPRDEERRAVPVQQAVDRRDECR